jgi:hypothetical protein
VALGPPKGHPSVTQTQSQTQSQSAEGRNDCPQTGKTLLALAISLENAEAKTHFSPDLEWILKATGITGEAWNSRQQQQQADHFIARIKYECKSYIGGRADLGINFRRSAVGAIKD